MPDCGQPSTSGPSQQFSPSRPSFEGVFQPRQASSSGPSRPRTRTRGRRNKKRHHQENESGYGNNPIEEIALCENEPESNTIPEPSRYVLNTGKPSPSHVQCLVNLYQFKCSVSGKH
ncbi:uncharacterized protein LOC117321332 [Pecten maximus]|uniref:uncharacterized protein LOC117321332 n=1 Tax=Pecten maximus TaxID=6579 RepID=UPI001457FC77|nr:uncharacterized protein LOC117321332 [Pecten maximus]